MTRSFLTGEQSFGRKKRSDRKAVMAATYNICRVQHRFSQKITMLWMTFSRHPKMFGQSGYLDPNVFSDQETRFHKPRMHASLFCTAYTWQKPNYTRTINYNLVPPRAMSERYALILECHNVRQQSSELIRPLCACTAKTSPVCIPQKTYKTPADLVRWSFSVWPVHILDLPPFYIQFTGHPSSRVVLGVAPHEGNLASTPSPNLLERGYIYLSRNGFVSDCCPPGGENEHHRYNNI